MSHMARMLGLPIYAGGLFTLKGLGYVATYLFPAIVVGGILLFFSFMTAGIRRDMEDE